MTGLRESNNLWPEVFVKGHKNASFFSTGMDRQTNRQTDAWIAALFSALPPIWWKHNKSTCSWRSVIIPHMISHGSLEDTRIAPQKMLSPDHLVLYAQLCPLIHPAGYNTSHALNIDFIYQ